MIWPGNEIRSSFMFKFIFKEMLNDYNDEKSKKKEKQNNRSIDSII